MSHLFTQKRPDPLEPAQMEDPTDEFRRLGGPSLKRTQMRDGGGRSR